MMRSTRITANVATVECHKQVRCWRLLRAIMEVLIPTCNNCTFVQESSNHNNTSTNYKPKNSSMTHQNPSCTSSTIFTGTIFGCKRGKVKFCVQQSNNSIILLELAVPTSALAREMRGGLLRIALECTNTDTASQSLPLLETSVWRMYCNGRRVGFAVKRHPSKADMAVLRRMSGVVVGAGVVSGAEVGCDGDDIMYLRGNFERVRGSSDAESYHFIDPDGHTNQDLSIFFLRS
ncbi:hypothetical protein RND81_13G218100 [Saponaria officinalis]|uniref:Protein MIZU-KUSSEI 1-like n=1 Tax=Saponaria officinalis TaxID=3572 RepID=A0AAW1H473_SAPOF